MSTQSSIEDIREQEENIFEDLGCYDFTSLETTSSNSIKNKARQQLAVSADSPFSINKDLDVNQLQRLKNERILLLREETNEIRRQLDFVKNRLNELKNANKNNGNKKSSSKQDVVRNGSRSPSNSVANNKLSDQNDKEKPKTKNVTSDRNKPRSEPKFRPLTGQADCPNCVCDRRNSVCDLCFKLTSPAITSQLKYDLTKNKTSNSTSEKETTYRRNTSCSLYNSDERPIRPAQDKTLGLVEAVDDVVVPNNVYTISKSLNDKRTKLAQAINDLQVMMEQVKEKGERLNKERKVVQLYKDQWKFGPSIGGPKASSRDRLGSTNHRRNYQSRLDPNLSRDISSVMGFQHIEPVMKLRQYNPEPRPKPLLKQPQRRVPHSRSKSLESLKMVPTSKANTSLQRAIANFQNGKASSEFNIASGANTTTTTIDEKSDEVEEDIVEIEEKTEQSISPELSEKEVLHSESVQAKNQDQPPMEGAQDERENYRGEKVKRMTWIPVFGETEIKTVKRPAAKRKVHIISPENKTIPTQSSSRNPATNSRKAIRKPAFNSNNTLNRTRNFNGSRSVSKDNVNDRVINEAKRKLKFASNLLEEERRDSSTKNQIVVNKAPIPKPRSSTSSPLKNSTTNQDTTKALETSKEIARLEEMVNEQQKLLNRLTQSQERQLLVSPVTVSCSSPCFARIAPARNTLNHRLNHGLYNNRSLIFGLKDRLNKGKMRLAQTLEAEREKHQQLKQKVDSSLRKQSDLEHENEILKQSLNKCIDTCLKDISNTFESLSATLTDSIDSSSQGNTQTNEDDEDDSRNSSSGSLLTNAAQLISDNRHLKQIRNHVEVIEKQRKGIFEELSKEKQKSNQLECQLKVSQAELDQLAEAKRRLEAQLAKVTNEQRQQDETQPKQIEKNQSTIEIPDCQPSTSGQANLNMSLNLTTDTDRSESDETYNSVEVYRRYIQSMSPDIESLRRERKLILSEFDNIKKMLSDIET